MIVVVVLAIAAVIAAPMFKATDATRLDSACKLLVADLQFAKMYSLSHPDTPCGIKIDGGSVGYRIGTSNAATFNCATMVAVTDEISDAAYINTYGSGRATELKGVSVNAYSLGGDACVAFDALGALDQSATATITLRAGGKDRVISIDAISGEATIGP